MKTRIFAGLALIAIVTYVVVSAVRTRPFSPAADLPRGALMYAQFEDLPNFIKSWNKSDFKGKFLKSQNLDDLSKRHLGMKIASRWQEFSDAAGFPIDLDTVSTLADKRAAVAVYDIGKLDLVFIAPMKSELFEATSLMQNSDKFEDEQLVDRTRIYHVDVDSDQGRQKQQILFTHVKDRLIVATSEKLLAQTVSIITGRLRKNALADDPAFSTLAAQTVPKTMTVWVDQAALNTDYYFKKYWLMSDVESLKNIRSAIFDLNVGDGEIVENREFLLKTTPSSDAVEPQDARQLVTHIPGNTPYYRIQRANPETLERSLTSVLGVDRSSDSSGGSATDASYISNTFYDDDGGGDNYDKYINETEDENAIVEKNRSTDLTETIRPAGPRSILTLERSREEAEPLFTEFDRAAVITLTSSGALDRIAFEQSLSDALSARLMVRGQRLDGRWITITDNGSAWREFDAAALEWSVQYAVSGNKLVVTNEPAFLKEVLAGRRQAVNVTGPFSEMTVVQPTKIRDDFESTFQKLSVGKSDFFIGNILGLVDSAPAVAKIEKNRTYEGNLMREQLKMILEPTDSK